MPNNLIAYREALEALDHATRLFDRLSRRHCCGLARIELPPDLDTVYAAMMEAEKRVERASRNVRSH